MFLKEVSYGLNLAKQSWITCLSVFVLLNENQMPKLKVQQIHTLSVTHKKKKHLNQFHPLKFWRDTTSLIGPNRPVQPWVMRRSKQQETSKLQLPLHWKCLVCPERVLLLPLNRPNGLYCVRHLSFHSTGHPESLHTTLTCTLGAESGQGLCQECLSKQMLFTPDLYRCMDRNEPPYSLWDEYFRGLYVIEKLVSLRTWSHLTQSGGRTKENSSHSC